MTGFQVLEAQEIRFAPPSWDPDLTGRELVELRAEAGLCHSQAALWRYSPGGGNRRHREPVQEEVFCVIEGTLTAYLGESAERLELAPRSVAVVQAGTALQLRNESDTDVIFFAYGAPLQPSDYQAEILDDVTTDRQ